MGLCACESETAVFQCVTARSNQGKLISFPSTLSPLELPLAFRAQVPPRSDPLPPREHPPAPLRRAPWRHRPSPAPGRAPPLPANLAPSPPDAFVVAAPEKHPAPGLGVWPIRAAPSRRCGCSGTRTRTNAERGDSPHSLRNGTERSGTFRARAKGKTPGKFLIR